MNLLKTIIERLNQRVEVANIFDQIYPLCELNANGNDKAWVHYIGNGQAEVVTNFDAKQGTLFWAKRGKVSVTKTESLKVSGCKTLYLTSFPLTAYAVVRKSHLPCDSEDSQDWIASRIYRLISGTDPDFKVSIGVIQYEVIPNGYVNEIKSLPSNYEWACVAVDVDINVVSSSEDGCYDVCATGDIPLPDFQPCTPCLTEVAVDGVTITGNGTTANPLVAIGGGGSSILLQTDNVNNGSQTILNLKEGTNITLTDDGIGGVTIDASGSGLPQSLQEVTDVGNTTTNDIQFGSGVGVLLDNGARLREGTTNGGLGGNKGIAQRCSIDYELKWEAGRLYYMEQDGFTIREVTHNFTFTPSVNDDSTKGFVNGSRWVLDNGDLYVCSDATSSAAIWNLQSVGGVTDVTATSPLASSGGNTPDISIQPANLFDDGYLTSADFTSFYNKFDVPTGTTSEYLDGLGTPTTFPTIPNAQVNSDWNATTGVEEILNKPTIPTATSDLTNDSGFITIGDVPTQVNSDWNATSGFAEILNKPSIPAAQIQSDWNQSNNVALDYIKNKPTIPTNGLPSGGTAGQILTKVDATDYNATWQENYADWTSVVKHIVKNNGLSGTITKGTAVYVTGSNGTNMLVGRASNASEATSSKTMGLMESDITTTGGTQTGFVITEGLLGNLNTAGTTAGDPVWLGVNGALIYGLINKPYAPAHLVFIGIVTKVSAGNGEIFVKVQNGFELKEIHDVDLITTTPINGHVLGFDGTLWVNKTIATWLGFTPVTDARTISTTAPLTGGGDLTANRTLSITSSALTKTDDTNVTLTLGGSPTTSLLAATSLTLGWTGTLADSRIASATTWNAKQNAITLTTTGTSGAATLTGATLNIPQYSSGAGLVYKSTVDTGAFLSTSNTAVYTQLIAANTYTIGDILRVTYRARKTGTNGIQILRIYVNATADLAGTPLLVGQFRGTAANTIFQMQRHLAIKSSTANTEVFSTATTGVTTDFAQDVPSTIVIDWTATKYFVFALQNASALDTNYGSMFLIEKL